MKNILIILIAIYILGSCKYSNIDIDENGGDSVDSIHINRIKTPDSLIIGDEKGMVIIKYNKTIECGPGFERIWIDPSKTGNNLFWIDIPCGGQPLGASLSSTPFIETSEKVGGEIIDDTMYTSKKINIYYDSIYWKKVVVNKSTKTGCYPFYDVYTYKIRRSQIVAIYKNGDIISKNSNFITGKTFLRESQGNINPSIYYKGDTVFLESNHWDYDCHKLPGEGTFYLAIKIAEYDISNQQIVDEKLGWLKFTYNSLKQLILVESAIQK